MENNDLITGLFSILWNYDNSWTIEYVYYDQAVITVISNNDKQVIVAPTLVAALKAAISLYGVNV